MDRFGGLAKLDARAREKAGGQGYLTGLDGRRLPCRADYRALNNMLQSAEGICAKQTIVNYDRSLTQMLGPQGWTGKWAAQLWNHDELQLASGAEHGELVKGTIIESIAMAGEQFNLAVPLTGEGKIGHNWSDEPLNILEARKAGLTWAECATACGLGSETAARRAHKKAEHPKYTASLEVAGVMVDSGDEYENHDALPSIDLFTEDPEVEYEATLSPVLFVPDYHIPYESKTTWALMYTVAEELKPDTIVIMGDFGDFKAVSSHLKNPIDKTRLKWEMEQCNRRLDQLDELGAHRKIFLAGNHEWRLQRYLQEKAPELYDMISVPELFRLKERGWEYVEYMQHARLGSLYLTHSGGGTGVGSAQKGHGYVWAFSG